MSAMPGNDWGEIFYNVFVIYLFLTLVQTCYSVIRMYIVKHFCNVISLRYRLNFFRRAGVSEKFIAFFLILKS